MTSAWLIMLGMVCFGCSWEIDLPLQLVAILDLLPPPDGTGYVAGPHHLPSVRVPVQFFESGVHVFG